MRTKFKPWCPVYLNEHPEVSPKLEDIENFFANKKEIYLEIGSGKGQFLINMANKHTDEIFVGIEKDLTCAGITAKKIVDNEIKNAYMLPYDIEKLFPLIKGGSVKKIYLNFSDPWPKKRHNKRRLTADRFLEEYKRIMSDDGELIQKTDNVDLFEFSTKNYNNNGFDIFYLTNDYKQDDMDDVTTEYEQRFIQNQIPINRLKARKKA